MTLECGWSCRGQWGNRSGNARGCRYCYTADRVRGFVLSLATVDFGWNNPVVTSPYVLVSSRECRKKGVKRMLRSMNSRSDQECDRLQDRYYSHLPV